MNKLLGVLGPCFIWPCTAVLQAGGRQCWDSPASVQTGYPIVLIQSCSIKPTITMTVWGLIICNERPRSASLSRRSQHVPAKNKCILCCRFHCKVDMKCMVSYIQWYHEMNNGKQELNKPILLTITKCWRECEAAEDGGHPGHALQLLHTQSGPAGPGALQVDTTLTLY